MVDRYSIQELKDIVAPLAQKYGAQRVYLFGSYARRDMTESSDVDLRIDKGSIRGLALAGFLVDLEDALGLKVDLIPTTSLDGQFLSSIPEDEVLTVIAVSWNTSFPTVSRSKQPSTALETVMPFFPMTPFIETQRPSVSFKLGSWLAS